MFRPSRNSSHKIKTDPKRKLFARSLKFDKTVPVRTNMPAFNNVPAEFICPLSLQVMVKPLVTKSGQHFERSAILQWLAQGRDYCPKTGESLKPSDMIPDTRLEANLAFWRYNNGVDLLGAQDNNKKAVFIGVGALDLSQPETKPKSSSKSFLPKMFRPVKSKVTAASA